MGTNHWTGSTPRKLVAEFIGTFALVFGGCGAIAADQFTGAVTHLGVCLTFGLVVCVMIYATGHISEPTLIRLFPSVLRARDTSPGARYPPSCIEPMSRSSTWYRGAPVACSHGGPRGDNAGVLGA